MGLFGKKKGRGLKKRTGVPVYEGEGDVRLVRAKVVSVDNVKWTATIQPEHGGNPIPGVPIEPMMINSSGGGSYFMPEQNSVVWACTPSTDATPFIMGGATLPKQTDEGDENEDPNDRRMNRPVLEGGDCALAVSEQGHIFMRKGGTVEIGASESCKRVYLPLKNMVREFSQNWEHQIGGGGKISVLARDEDARFGSDLTPAEFQLQISEFAEDVDPVIDLRLGRIKDEDESKCPTGNLGAIVARFVINGAYNVWIDKDGNFVTRVHGAVYESYVGPRTKIQQANVKDIIKGTLEGDYTQRKVIVQTTDTLDVLQDRNITVGGNYKENVEKAVTKTGSALTEEYGNVDRTINGTVTERFVGAHSQNIGNDRAVTVAGRSSETITGTKSTMVIGDLPTDRAYQLYVNSGVLNHHVNVGKILLTCGLADPLLATSRIAIRPASVSMQTPLGVTKFEVNPSGFQISTVAGEISLDQAGTVTLGIGPVFGGVVTTLTHPVDLVTGAPTIGSLSVQAGGPPGANAFGVIPFPSTFLPDLTP
jgi:hypothetical protein